MCVCVCVFFCFLAIVHSFSSRYGACLRCSNSGFVAFFRRDDAEKAKTALSESELEGRGLQIMWAKAVRVGDASQTTGMNVVVSRDTVIDTVRAAAKPAPTTGTARRGVCVCVCVCVCVYSVRPACPDVVLRFARSEQLGSRALKSFRAVSYA